MRILEMVIPGVILIAATGAAFSRVHAAYEVVIAPSKAEGPEVEHFGWDVKGGVTPARTEKLAQLHYGIMPANLLRIPLLCAAHGADGSIDETQYEKIINAVKNAKAVNSDIVVFASLKLEGATTFPKWMTDNEMGQIFDNPVRKPNPRAYGKIWADYIEYCSKHGVAIHVVGLNNEVENALTADRYVQSAKFFVADLRRRRLSKEFNSFRFIGPETFSLRAGIVQAESIKRMGGNGLHGIVGAHFYPDSKFKDTPADWDQIRRFMPLQRMWHTEIHINPRDDETNIARMRRSMGILFASNRQGVSGFVFWQDAASDNQIDALLKRSLLTHMIGAKPVATAPRYDPKDPNENAPLFQAYVREDQLTLFVANPGAALKQLPVRLIKDRLQPESESVYWRGPGNDVKPDATGEFNIQIHESSRGLVITEVPANSVGFIKLKLR